MKKPSLFLWVVLAAVISSLATSYVSLGNRGNSHDSTGSKAPGTYERIMQSGKVVCGYFPWPVYAEKDPNTGKLSGLTIDLVEKALATLDLKVEWKELILGTQIQDLETGKVDVVCIDGPFIMPTGKLVEFSNPLFASVVIPYVRADDDRFKAKADFNNESVKFVGLDGDFSADLVQRRFPKAQLKSTPATTDVSQLFLDVATKKVDVTIGDPLGFKVFDKNNPGKLKAFMPDKPVGTYKLVLSVSKGDMKTLGLLNQAIDNAAAFGITEEVLNQYDSEPRTLKRVRSIYED
jgi:ABC-type amino acid transport substrate-binding protein